MAPDEDVISAAPATHYRVELTQTKETYTCLPHETLLQGMARLGRRGIPVGCLNGGCGICKVAVVQGSWESTGPMSRAHVSAEEEARRRVPTFRLKCWARCRNLFSKAGVRRYRARGGMKLAAENYGCPC